MRAKPCLWVIMLARALRTRTRRFAAAGLMLLVLPAAAQAPFITDLRACRPADAAVAECDGPQGWGLRRTNGPEGAVLDLLLPAPHRDLRPGTTIALAPGVVLDPMVEWWGPAGEWPHALVLRGSQPDPTGRAGSVQDILVLRMGEDGGVCRLGSLRDQPDRDARVAALAVRARTLPCLPPPRGIVPGRP